MKRILFVAVSAATLAAAGAASAQVSQAVAINATVASKCGISAQSTTVTVPTDLTNSDARVRSSVTADIATALNGAQVVAFCNGANSSVQVTRGVLRRSGSTGSQLGVGGFAQLIRYNLKTSLNGVVLDSTETANAATVAAPFGGHVSLGDPNTRILFQQSDTDGAAVATSSNSGAADTDAVWGQNTDRRLLAGAYTGSVNITLTPSA